MSRAILDWVNVVSSNIEAVAFEDVWEDVWRQVGGHYGFSHAERSPVGTLHILFHGGRHYGYADVPVKVYEELLAAPSKGKFWAKRKWDYAFTQF